MKNISVILPIYNEESGIEHACKQISEVFSNVPYALDLVLIDDGSTDQSWQVICRITKQHSHVRAFSLSRNFGKEKAMFAGIQHSLAADAVIIMDADLQHPPEIISELIQKWETTNCDVVHAVKQGRNNESDSNHVLVNLFYTLYRWATGVSITGASDFKLLSQRAATSYAQLSERDLFFRGLVPWLGFQQEMVTFQIEQRAHDSGKWSFTKRLSTGLHAITSFSSLPLQIITIIGVFFLLGAVGLSARTLYQWLSGTALEGFSTVIILLLVIGAAIMISLGIIGQYLARIYEEIKARPVYLIKDSVGESNSNQNV